MLLAMFYHSLVSDWNHGNAHFLRGVVSELLHRGHQVEVFEPEDGWSRSNALAQHGRLAVDCFRSAYPQLRSTFYTLENLDLDRVLNAADAVVVHEWNDAELIRRIGRHRARGARYRLLFHDTHHRSVTAPAEMARYDLSHYDGVLAFGAVIRQLYLDRDWAARAWTWHEAADTRVFRPLAKSPREGQLVWIGNWGDDERTEELHEFLLGPIRQLRLAARVYGVRYPSSAQRALANVGAEYCGWLPNPRVPEVFGKFALTTHIPRRPYRQCLPGIPTIRVFEALACGIPLLCAPWEDAEHLFRPGRDYLAARHGGEMTQLIRQVLHEPQLAEQLARCGRETVLARHTCRHRVDELLSILGELGVDVPPRSSAVPQAAGVCTPHFLTTS
jgi:spore maturation protein CgeB